MAFRISSPANANITNEQSTSFSVSCTDFAYWGGADDYLEVRLRINGVQVGFEILDLSTATASTNVKTVSFNLNSIKSSIYDEATGHSLTGCVSIDAVNGDRVNPAWHVDATPLTSGNLTITARLSSFSWSTMANPYDLDSAGGLMSSWARPHTAFYGRFKVYINGTLCVNRYGFTTSTSFDPDTYGYVPAMVTAMGGVSPREFKIMLITEFLSDSYQDLDSGQSLIRSSGVIKDFFVASTVSVFNSFPIGTDPSVTLNVGGGTVYHRLIFKVGTTVVKSIDWGTTSTGTVTFDSTNWGTILATFTDGGLSASVTLEVKTYSDASYTTQIGSTQTASTTATATASTISGFNAFNIESAGTAGFTVNPSYAGFVHGIEYKVGATSIKSYVGSAGTTFSNAEKDIIYGAFTSGALVTVVTAYLTTYYYDGVTYKRIGAVANSSANGTAIASTITVASTPISLDDVGTINASLLTVANGSSRFTHVVLTKLGATTLRTDSSVVTGGATSYQALLTLAQQQAIFNATTGAMSALLTYELATYFGAIQIGAVSTKTATANFPALLPTLTGLTIVEANALNTTGHYVQLISKIRATQTGVTFKYGATVVSQTYTFEGVTRANGSDSEAISGTSITTGLAVKGTVTDSRGQVKEFTVYIIVEAYATPVITAYSVKRASDVGGTESVTGTYLKFIYQVSASPIPLVNTHNLIRLKLYSKVKGGLTWTEKYNAVISGLSANTFMCFSGYPIDTAYDTMIEIDDLFGTPYSVAVLATGNIPMSMGKKGIGVGKVTSDVYAIEAGTDGMTNEGKYVSTLADGTTPMEVLSTTLVANLNVDKLDSQHGSYYLTRSNHTGTMSADSIIDGTTNKAYTATEKTKLAGIASGAQVNNISDVNATDLTDAGASALHYHTADRARANHTGTQSADTITDGTTNKVFTATEKTKLASIGSGNGAHIMCYNNARAQSIASGTGTIVQVDTIITNTDATVFEQNGYGIKCKIAGLYTIDVMVAFTTTGTTGRTGVSVLKNAVQFDLGFIPMRDNYDKAVGSMTLPLAVNDTIYFQAYQNSGSAKTLAIGGYVSENRMSISKVA